MKMEKMENEEVVVEGMAEMDLHAPAFHA